MTGPEGAKLQPASWFPVVMMGIMSLISYLDRSVLAILSPTILKQTGISTEQYFWVVSAFSLAYVVGNPFWGYHIDRRGPRLIVPLAVFLWTVASVSHAYVATFLGFALARVVLGFGEGATFPGGFRTVHDQLPERARGRGISIAYSGGSLGAILAPLVITPVGVRYGWQAAFLVTGFLGAGWVLLWALLPHRRPSGGETAAREKVGPMPRWYDSRLWAYMLLYGFGALPLAFGIYAAPLYLSNVLGLSQTRIGKLVWLLPAGWELGYIAAGWVFDRRRKRQKALTPAWLRAVTFGFTLPGICLVITGAFTSLPVVLLLLTLPMFTAGGLVIAALRYGELAFPEQSALISGLGAGFWSLVVFLAMPQVGRFFNHAQYVDAFRFVSIFPLVGLVGWRLLAFRASPANLRKV